MLARKQVSGRSLSTGSATEDENKDLVDNWFNRYRIEKVKRGQNRDKQLIDLGFYEILDDL